MKIRNIVIGIVLMAMAAVSACAQQYDPESDFKAEPVDGGKSVRITEYVGNKWEVRIPPRIRGLPVTHIGDEAFREKNLTSVTIPNSVTHLSGFNDNQLTSITIPDNVIEIGYAAFFGNQLTSVTIPDSVTKIGTASFQSNQLTSITIGNGVTVIEGGAFAHNQLTSVTIGNGVTEIEQWAFIDNQLTSVTIPDSVTTIWGAAFSGLTSITIGNGVTLGVEDHWGNKRNSFPGFDKFYETNGSKAGTYTYNENVGTWSAVYR